MSSQKNVLGGELETCCFEPITGHLRDGYCKAETEDFGRHTVCAIMTQEFLDFTASKGNDLSTPNKMFGFPGLKPGDKWCLCALRWLEAYNQGVAPKVVLEATNELTLEVVKLEDIQKNAVC